MTAQRIDSGADPALRGERPEAAAPPPGAAPRRVVVPDGAPTPAEALDTAHELAPRFAARAAGHDAEGTFPTEDFADLRAAGLLGLLVPRRLGGSGASFAEYAAVAEAVATGAGATALVYNMHASVTGALAHTPDALLHELGVGEEVFAARDRALTAAAGGALYGVAMSERGAGSRLSRITTAYRRVGDGFRLTGAKTFVSGAGHADAYLVAARERTDGPGADEPGTPQPSADDAAPARVSYFLVPAGEGVRVEPTWDSLGMRATGSHDLHLDVRLPADALLGGIDGLAVLLAQVMPQWLVASYAAVYVGVARSALAAAAEHATGRGLDTLPLVRARLGRADAATAAAGLVVAEAARRVSEAPGEPGTNRWVWRAKLVAGDTAAEVASSALEAAGTSATRRGHPLERIYRDARCGALQPATSDVCADWLGVAALGGDPENAAGPSRW
ncbi:acyl-CoA dehydrogenase family protein [Streptomyces spiramenti]|uniref:Dibenzothiophene monooxygenase n=1 Tax=Streptomyces spiramenti TaxID=2720606 RepID=A0ABX1AY22_9ACTN|nr:acyl-CoA dehydrogenase [Streptomyces spiramenti]NJP69132.1 acyl-CoA dehydrogenase [Streptomyces spiramenti]